MALAVPGLPSLQYMQARRIRMHRHLFAGRCAAAGASFPCLIAKASTPK